MLQFRNYENALIEGAKIIGKDMSVGFQYGSFAIGSQGATALSVFQPTATAPTAGTITGFFVSQAGAAGSAVVFGTTAGTIAIISYGTTVGTFTGTAILNAAVVAGDTVSVYNTGTGMGTATFYVNFQTTT